MTELVPDRHDVLVVTSRPAEGGARRFVVETPGDLEPPELPPELSHEAELIARFRAAGFRLTMVGGGSRPEDVRRFYFRPAAGPRPESTARRSSGGAREDPGKGG